MDHEIEFRWKEMVIYWEGSYGFVFDGGWGVSPPITYVPDGDHWDDVVPGWMRGRRSEIVDRLRAHPGHLVAEVADGWAPLDGREIRRDQIT